MAQLGVVYRFMLREVGKPDSEHRLLGSFDGAGASFFQVGPTLLKQVAYHVDVEGLDDPQPSVTFKSSLPVSGPDRFSGVFHHHEYGSRGVLNRHLQGDVTPFSEVDNQQVEVALLVSGNPMHRVGFFAFHVPNRRGIKTGVEAELRRLLREQFDLTILLEPVVPIDAVEAAIESHGLGSVSFRKLNNPSGLFDADDAWWTDGQQLGGVELRLRPTKSERLLGRKLVSFIRTLKNELRDGEEPVQFTELATIDEHTYDELSVEVYIGGRKKVMRVTADGHSMSHAFSWDLELPAGAASEAVVASLEGILPTGPS